MANNLWSNYTEKTATPVDADEVMVRDSTDGKNKRLLFGTFWKWVAKKLNEATISELDTDNKTIIGAINALYGKTKIGNIRYISCGEYGTLAVFTVGKLLYCKFNGNDKNSQSVQTNVAQLPDEYILNDSIGVYRAALIGGANTNIGNIQIKADGNIDMYCPYPYLYGIVIIPTK